MSSPTITAEQVAKAIELLRANYSLAATARHLDLDTAGYRALRQRVRKNLHEDCPQPLGRKKTHREVGAE